MAIPVRTIELTRRAASTTVCAVAAHAGRAAPMTRRISGAFGSREEEVPARDGCYLVADALRTCDPPRNTMPENALAWSAVSSMRPPLQSSCVRSIVPETTSL